MSVETKRISVTELQPGMCLGAAALDAHGHVLLAAGAMLGQSVIDSLARHGVESVEIEKEAEEEADEQPALTEAQRRMLAERLNYLFRKSTAEGAGAELLRQLRCYRGVTEND